MPGFRVVPLAPLARTPDASPKRLRSPDSPLINDGYSVLARLGRMGPGGAGESKGVKRLGILTILGFGDASLVPGGIVGNQITRVIAGSGNYR